MAVIINNVRVPAGAVDKEIIERAITRLGNFRTHMAKAYIMKKSVDARRREICFVCSVGVEFADPSAEARAVEAAHSPEIKLKMTAPYDPPSGNEKMTSAPVVAGFGPAGMFAALLLARRGYAPVVIERGGDMDERVAAVEGFTGGSALDPETNVQFGEGGAGTFSDGKLTTRINDLRCGVILRKFVENGAPAEIEMQSKPHIGTDNLRHVVKSVRKEIIKCGGRVCFNTRMRGLVTHNGKITAVKTDGGEIKTQALILAIGHSARDTFKMLLEAGAGLSQKPFSVGVRIEHLQNDIDRALYGKFAGDPSLPHGEYQMSLRRGGRCVYTFCMCPGGQVVAAASENGGIVTNGMSRYARDGENANCALAVSVGPDDFGPGPLGGVEFQRRIEKAAYSASGGYRAPCTTAGAFIRGGPARFGRVLPTYLPGVEPYPVGKLFPSYVSEYLKTGIKAFGRRLNGFDADDAVLTGPETRTSSPVRIRRDGNMESPDVGGLYPAGEGAGYAGGIMSAAADGLKAAEAVMKRYAPVI